MRLLYKVCFSVKLSSLDPDRSYESSLNVAASEDAEEAISIAKKIATSGSHFKDDEITGFRLTSVEIIGAVDN